MSTYRLHRLLGPRSIAIAGIGAREGSVGRVILRNIREAGFPGEIHLVHPREQAIDGLSCIRSIDELPAPVDLLVVAAPPEAVPELVAQAGAKGCQGAVIVTAGLGHGPDSLSERARIAARVHGLRLIGPNCLGVMSPTAKLNASFAARPAPPGGLALVSQSGAMAAGIVEWAAARKVGFTAVLSLGDTIDVDLGDCLDYLAEDAQTRAILLYVESIVDVRKFLSAARAASRVKPVIAMKSGRHAAGAQAAATHTGALAGSDAVYDAAFRRAGVLRALTLDEMFAAAETLGRLAPFSGERLAILTNGGGLGVLAADLLEDFALPAATLSPATLARLDAALPSTWSHGNPVDVVGDAGPERYAASLEALLDDEGVDAVLAMQIPTALAQGADSGRAVIDVVEARRKATPTQKPVFAAWVGAQAATIAAFDAAGLPNFASESTAIMGYSHVVNYARAQRALSATPTAHDDFAPDRAAAEAAIRSALAQGREWLDPLEIADVLDAYGVSAPKIALAKTPEEAAVMAREMLREGRVALKLHSRDIPHKSDVGGVELSLASEAEVLAAGRRIIAAVAVKRPQARIEGLLVQAMIERPRARELLVGVADDPTFGPVVAFGSGGVAVEIVDDKALALPPLDIDAARPLMARTRVSRLLSGYRGVSAADVGAVADVLARVSRLVCDFREIRELDINPLLADDLGSIAIDARMRVSPSPPPERPRIAGNPRLAIRPYPADWVSEHVPPGGPPLRIRPVRGDDEDAIRTMLTRVAPEDIRRRFLAPISEFSHAMLARLTQLDYSRAMAFVAVETPGGDALGIVRIAGDANHEKAEFAILVRTDHKGGGLGYVLMKTIVAWARADGYAELFGRTLAGNAPMIQLAREFGFVIAPDPREAGIRMMTLSLDGNDAGS